jgi:hypothetical protein
MNWLTVRPSTNSSLISVAESNPILAILLSRASPWKSLLGSVGASNSRFLAMVLILPSRYWTLQISFLFLSPYTPIVLSSWLILSFSHGLLGTEYVLLSIYKSTIAVPLSHPILMNKLNKSKKIECKIITFIVMKFTLVIKPKGMD